MNGITARDFANKGTFKADDTRNDGVERYVVATPQGQDMTSAPPAQEQEPTVWGEYNKRGENYDKYLVKDANNTVEVLLIFPGLISPVVTAFISQTYPMLRVDPNNILMSIYQRERYPNTNTTLDQPFVAPPYAVRVNCFLFTALFTSMLVVMLRILVKQWTRSYERELAGLSIFMHLALFISAVGIIDLLLSAAPTVGYVALSVFHIGVGFFLFTTTVPLLFHEAPFRSPLSRFLCSLKRKVIQSQQFTRQRPKTTDGEADLDDHVELSEEQGSEENNIVKTDIKLDVDIACHLLTNADKSTDRWLFDLRFSKLPRLTRMERDHRDAFLSRNVIIEVYMFLAKGCVEWSPGRNGKNGRYDIMSGRAKRAKDLCRFLGWYLSLSSTQPMRTAVAETFNKNGNPLTLPELLAKDPDDRSLVLGCSVQGVWEHLIREEDPRDGCPVCHAYAERLSQLATSSDPATPKDAEVIEQLTVILLKQTNCLLLSARDATMVRDRARTRSNATLPKIRTVLKDIQPTEAQKKLWLSILSEGERTASPELIDHWLKVLKPEIEGLSIKATTDLLLPAQRSPVARPTTFSDVFTTSQDIHSPRSQRSPWPSLTAWRELTAFRPTGFACLWIWYLTQHPCCHLRQGGASHPPTVGSA